MPISAGKLFRAFKQITDTSKNALTTAIYRCGTTQININTTYPICELRASTRLATVAGSTMTVNWTGQTPKCARPKCDARDAVYFSINDTLDASDQRLALTVLSTDRSPSAQAYPAQAAVTIPIVRARHLFPDCRG